MLLTLLYIIFILTCLVLIVAVLLQPGKADAGALFTSSVSSTAFGPRGTQTLLAKITVGAAILFMLVALTISLGIGRERSVMETQPLGTTTTQQPQTPANTNAPAQPQNNAATAPAGTQSDATAPANANNGGGNSNAGGSTNTNAATTASPAATDAKPAQSSSPGKQ